MGYILLIQSGCQAWGCFSVRIGNVAVELGVPTYGARPQTWSWIRSFCWGRAFWCWVVALAHLADVPVLAVVKLALFFVEELAHFR